MPILPARPAVCQVVNVANPANPFPVVGLPTSLSAAYIVVADTIAYVSDVYSGMAVINIADPSAPVEIAGRRSPAERPERMASSI